MSTDVLPVVAPHDSCIACFRGDTPTGLFFCGSHATHVAIHLVLGIPEDQAHASTTYAYEKAGLTKPEDQLTCRYTICKACASKTQLPALTAIDSDVVYSLGIEAGDHDA